MVLTPPRPPGVRVHGCQAEEAAKEEAAAVVAAAEKAERERATARLRAPKPPGAICSQFKLNILKLLPACWLYA